MKTLFTILFLLVAGMAGAQTPVQTANFNLSWTDNSNNEDGFRVERSTSVNGPFAQVGIVSKDVKTFTDAIANDPGGKQYCFRVMSYNIAGTSAFSNVACASSPSIIVPPAAPGPLTVSVTVTLP
jgi:hypothetical protein